MKEMLIPQRFPQENDVDVASMLGELRNEAGQPRLAVGDERIIEFLNRFARKLLAPGIARRYPELASLGFFLRTGEITKALTKLNNGGHDALRYPRGLVFHIPPTNVDTIFVYSWALSALAGNRNVVRLSSRSTDTADVVLDAMNTALAETDVETAQLIGGTQRIVTFGHDDNVTAAYSRACDLRVIWGGDTAIETLREYPMAPHARDLTFPDRSSFAIVSVEGWLRASESERRGAAEGFYNDAYWFDQAACSSPRAVFWVGDGAKGEEAADEFRSLLVEVLAARHYVTESAMAVQKRVATYGAAADGRIDSIEFGGPSDDVNGVAILELAQPVVMPREWWGAGTFAKGHVDSLGDLAKLITRKDQTVTQFGFTREELLSFVQGLSGRGVDRIVPFGSALSFAEIWDGYDLLAEFTRLVTVST